MKTIGIIGGGQLGKMLAISAKQMGYKVNVLEPNENSPCSFIVDKQIVGNYDDITALEELCKISDVITYEFENIPFEVIKKLESKYNIPQTHVPLKISQNRYLEKSSVLELGIKTAKFSKITSKSNLLKELDNIKFPAVLKTCSGGYDGKGQIIIRGNDDLTECFELVDKHECILEKFIDYDYEISVIITRSINKEISIFPIPYNIHKNNILHASITPCNISKSIEEKANKIASKIMNELNFYGILAVELFVLGEDVYFNEMAPRPHNSGHYTIEGCYTSQFEQHIRSILGLKLGNVNLRQPTIMVNILGQNMKGLESFVKSKDFYDAKIHLYGKTDALNNRKMGHITFMNSDYETVNLIIQKYFE